METTMFPLNGPFCTVGKFVLYMGTLRLAVMCLISMPAFRIAFSNEKEQPSAKMTRSSLQISSRLSTVSI
ncbi:hypothetical protein D3C85_1798120 [compost metagenome]